MDKREARQYISSNPPYDPFMAERRPSFLGRLFSRSRNSSMSEDSNMSMGLQRRGSIDPSDVAASLTQKLQDIKKPGKPTNPQEISSIFT